MVTTHPDLILIPRLTAPRRCQHFDPATTVRSQGVIAGIQVIHHLKELSIDCAWLRLSSHNRSTGRIGELYGALGVKSGSGPTFSTTNFSG